MKTSTKSSILAVTAVMIVMATVALMSVSPDVNDSATAVDVKKLRQENSFTKESFGGYVGKQWLELQNVAQTQPDREIQAGISFKKLMSQEEIDSIASVNRLNVEYFEYKATNGISGGAATILYKNLSQAAENLKTSHGADVIGVTYVFAKGKAADMQKLSQNSDVVLADVGFLKEIDEEKARGNTIGQSLPPNLYQQYQEHELGAKTP